MPKEHSMKKHRSVGNLRRSLSTLYLRFSGSSLCFDKDFCKKYFKGPLSAEVEASIQLRWSAILADPTRSVVVAQLTRPADQPGLGISLEGVVDVLRSGDEVRPHHYIRSVRPGGPVERDGRLRQQDELLEVNGRKLYGLNHMEVVEILKALPKHVRIVCARRRSQEGVSAALPDDQFVDDTSLVDIEQMDDDDLMTRSVVHRPPTSGGVSGGAVSGAAVGGNKSRSFDDFANASCWSSDDPTVVELEKTTAGLGFSVLDYQDPQSSDDTTVIIVRSLVPGGAAHRDGRLLPGDRLLFVNDTNLEHASLEDVVRCLKSAPRGRIVIGVAKPRPLAAASSGYAGATTAVSLATASAASGSSAARRSTADRRMISGGGYQRHLQWQQRKDVDDVDAITYAAESGSSFKRFPLGVKGDAYYLRWRY